MILLPIQDSPNPYVGSRYTDFDGRTEDCNDNNCEYCEECDFCLTHGSHDISCDMY